MNNINSNNIERIESYLTANQSPEEKLRFEADLERDKELYALFNLYRTINGEMHNTQKYSSHETALKSTLQKLNAAYFKSEVPVVRMSADKKLLRVAMSAAAVLALVLAAYFAFIYTEVSSTQLANRYVKKELMHLSLTMDGAKDSLQQGIAAYNDKNYTKAIQLFESVYKAHPDNSDALKYMGMVYLVTDEHNKAFQLFTELAAKKELFSNPGLFLKAVTLLQRNLPGDEEQARQLLQQVIDEKAEGSKEAERWLKK